MTSCAWPPLAYAGAKWDCTLREDYSQTNVILQYKLLASILSAVWSVIKQLLYELYFYYTLYEQKYDCKNYHALDLISATVFCATKQPPIQL